MTVSDSIARVYEPEAFSVLVVWFSLHAISIIVGGIAFWQRRESFPLKQRGVSEMMVLGVACLLWGVGYTFGRLMPCYWYYLLRVFGGNVGCWVWNARSWRLLFRFKIQDAYFRQSSSLMSPSPTKMREIDKDTSLSNADDTLLTTKPAINSWFVRNRHLSRWLYLVVPLVLVFALVLTFLAISVLEHREMLKVQPSCSQHVGSTFFYFAQAVFSLMLVFGFIVGVQFRGFSADAYRIKTELFGTGIHILIALILYLIFTKASTSPSIERYAILEMTGCLPMGAVAVWGYLWPIWLSLRESEAEKEMREANARTEEDVDFQAFLDVGDGMASWHKFLGSEFSIENILFWQDVTNFRAKLASGDFDDRARETTPCGSCVHRRVEPDTSETAPRQAVEACREIIEKFLETHSEMEVNVSSKAKFDIVAQKPALPQMSVTALSNIFVVPQAQIFKLMDTDSWPRYRRSPAYKQLLAERAQRATVRETTRLQVRHMTTPQSSARRRSEASPRSCSRRQSVAASMPGSRHGSRLGSGHGSRLGSGLEYSRSEWKNDAVPFSDLRISQPPASAPAGALPPRSPKGVESLAGSLPSSPRYRVSSTFTAFAQKRVGLSTETLRDLKEVNEVPRRRPSRRSFSRSFRGRSRGKSSVSPVHCRSDGDVSRPGSPSSVLATSQSSPSQSAIDKCGSDSGARRRRPPMLVLSAPVRSRRGSTSVALVRSALRMSTSVDSHIGTNHTPHTPRPSNSQKVKNSQSGYDGFSWSSVGLSVAEVSLEREEEEDAGEILVHVVRDSASVTTTPGGEKVKTSHI